MIDLEAAYEHLCLAARQGGAVAHIFQGKVNNEGKELDVADPDESEHLRLQKTAKTVVDEAVQEIVLLAASRIFDPSTLVVDAEENTPSLHLFPSKNGFMSLIVDPVDGTLEYIRGHDFYSVCIAVIENLRLRVSLVFFPASDTAYGVAPDGHAYKYPEFSALGTARAQEVIIPKGAKRVVYIGRRTPHDFIARFQSAGFDTVTEEQDPACASYVVPLLRVLRGEAAAYVACSPQIRDILIGPVIGNADGGFMCDWQGNEIVWPQTGRVDGFFGNSAFEDELRTILVNS
jgi:fructose-1,6-bisphosphatase/inositol monophosphatase family enzyme